MDMQAFDQVRQLAASQYLVRSLHVAAEMGVADAVTSGVGRIHDIARRVNANPDALLRILRLLGSRGIFRVDGDEVGHTAASEFLRSDHPQSLRSFVRMFGQPIQWQCAGDLQHAVATGEAVATRIFPDGGLWGYFAANPEEGRVFGEAMVAKSTVQIADVLAAHDFSAYRHIADIGGGSGHMLRAILARHPQATGTLFDLPPVIEQARSAGTNERLEFVAGDFFTTPLPPADATILMEVLHDWDDEHCARILAAVRKSMTATARLIVIEIEMPDGPGPDWPKLLDIVMLAAFAARQRTNAEYVRLLETNGFAVARQVSTAAGMTILEATASA
jgi:trans-aconitate methyltransferase